MVNEDNEYLDNLYRNYFEDLYNYAYAKVRNEFVAQDIVHDAFHEALEKPSKVRPHPNQIGWFKLVVKNKVHEYYRERESFLKICRSVSDLPLDIPDNRYDPAVLLTTESYNSIISRLQNFLTEDEFYLYRRFALEGASHLQIAKEMNISVWNSQKRLERIKKKLKKFPR